MMDGLKEASGTTILIVDDDPLMRSTVQRALRQKRVDVACAENGQKALDMLSSGLRPNLILLDIDMPKMNGLEVLSQLKQDPTLAPIPVVIISGALPNIEPNVARLLPKPFRLSELFDLLREHCGLAG